MIWYFHFSKSPIKILDTDSLKLLNPPIFFFMLNTCKTKERKERKGKERGGKGRRGEGSKYADTLNFSLKKKSETGKNKKKKKKKREEKKHRLLEKGKGGREEGEKTHFFF